MFQNCLQAKKWPAFSICLHVFKISLLPVQTFQNRCINTIVLSSTAAAATGLTDSLQCLTKGNDAGFSIFDQTLEFFINFKVKGLFSTDTVNVIDALLNGFQVLCKVFVLLLFRRFLHLIEKLIHVSMQCAQFFEKLLLTFISFGAYAGIFLLLLLVSFLLIVSIDIFGSVDYLTVQHFLIHFLHF